MYIRTKNGVYEALSEYEPSEYTKIVYGSKVISQSENIEELFDEFVVIRDSTKINQLVRTDDINYLKEMMKEDKRIVEVKGAIWTSKGLIYVAKMNDKGEFELI